MVKKKKKKDQSLWINSNKNKIQEKLTKNKVAPKKAKQKYFKVLFQK